LSSLVVELPLSLIAQGQLLISSENYVRRILMNNYYDPILAELANSVSKFDGAGIENVVDAIIRARRIFVAGTGRSGLMVKAFAMRLMHLGLKTYVVGETTTPGITDGDILIIGSGSGETRSVSNYARDAKKYHARLALITIFPDSTIGELADYKVVISAPTSKHLVENEVGSVQPMGSLFEQSLLLLLEGMILMLMEKLNVNPSEMFGNHANLE
jgi:6-phospho-3-hexuloisomerase